MNFALSMASSNQFRLATTPEADADLDLIVLSLVESSAPSAATSFLNEFNRICERLSDNPSLYQSYFLFVHRVNFRRFPYFVAYVIDSMSREVNIIMVAHQQANPERLARRLNL